MAEDDLPRIGGDLLEHLAPQRLHAEHRKQIRRGRNAGQAERAVGGRERQRAVVEDADVAQGFARQRPVERGGDRERVEPDRPVAAARFHPEADDAVGVGIGKRSKQDSVDDGEDRRGRADAESQRDDRQHGKCRAASQQPQGQPRVGGHVARPASQHGAEYDENFRQWQAGADHHRSSLAKSLP